MKPVANQQRPERIMKEIRRRTRVIWRLFHLCNTARIYRCKHPNNWI